MAQPMLFVPIMPIEEITAERRGQGWTKGFHKKTNDGLLK